MASFGNYPDKYLLFNSQASKNVSLLMQIEGVSDIYGIGATYKTVRYGDAGLVYGLPGLVYGALKLINNVKPYIVLDTGLTISQKIEPEQGKGNIGTINITLIDKNGEVSQVIAPGIVVDEIMMSKEVRLYLGFTQTSFPVDYLLIYRGYISQIVCPPGLVKFQISDGTTKKRQPICNTPTVSITTDIDNIDTLLHVNGHIGFHKPILGPDGNYDPTVTTYIHVNEEWMKVVDYPAYNRIEMVRASLDTIAVNHEHGTEVHNAIQFGDIFTGIHFIDLILKILLSGWNGPCETDVSIDSFGFNPKLSVNDTSVFVLKTLDAFEDLGLTEGDYFYITGATNPANNLSGRITNIQINDPTVYPKNVIIFTNQTFTLELTSSALTSFRSQYDTLPITAGAKCRMRDVDVSTFQLIKANYFNTGNSNISIFYSAAIQAKDAIDTDISLPMGCYGVSRFGRISMSIAKPPLPGIGKLVTLDKDTVIDPQNISITRSTNSRTFFNLISFQFDKKPGTDNYSTIQYFLDTDSLNNFNQLNILPINAPGIRTDSLGGANIINQRSTALLRRYKNCAIVIDVTVQWSVGSLIEVSDIVLLNDNGDLKIMNFETGKRNLGSQMFEVTDRTFNVSAGNVKLKLLGGLGFNVNARYGLYSPSTILNAGCTTTSMRVTPSFGQSDITNELTKWTPFIGLDVNVHSYDYSVQGTATIVGIDPSDPTAIQVTPALSFTPGSGYIMDIVPYPSDVNPLTDNLYKTLYAHYSPTVAITSGVSGTQFNINISDASKFIPDNYIYVRATDYNTTSNEVKIVSIAGTLVTCDDLGLTPDSTYFVEGLGFNDHLGYYRYD